MYRREFCRAILGVAFGASTYTFANPMRSLFRFVKEATGKTLVVIFQRGGCDGLNTIVPYGEDAYYNLRPNIGIARPNPGNSDSAIDLDGFFGLHPALAAFHPLFDNGHLAILPTVHYPEASRSHFDSEHFLESAASIGDRNNKDKLDGWLNRHLATRNKPGQLRAVSFGNSVAQALRGEANVSAFKDLSKFNLGLDEDRGDLLLSRLIGLYGRSPDPDTVNRSLTHSAGEVALNNLDVINDIHSENYIPANGAVYPTSTYGRQLMQTAQLIKANVGLEVVTISQGGYDTHGEQGGANGRHAERLFDFSNGIVALYQDLGDRMSDVVILTMSEFGRTAQQNGSMGTDHGNASSWFVISGGDNINGGIHGRWPGLKEDQLYKGRYLDFTVDYRNLLAEITTNFLGNPDLSIVFTGNGGADSPTSYNPLGVLS